MATKPAATLSVVVSPWAHVTLDGRSLGITPINGLRIKSGHRRLQIRNTALRQSETINLYVVPRAQVRIRRDWQETK